MSTYGNLTFAYGPDFLFMSYKELSRKEKSFVVKNIGEILNLLRVFTPW